MLITEHWIGDVAAYLKLPPEKVPSVNRKLESAVTHVQLPLCIDAM